MQGRALRACRAPRLTRWAGLDAGRGGAGKSNAECISLVQPRLVSLPALSLSQTHTEEGNSAPGVAVAKYGLKHVARWFDLFEHSLPERE